MITHEEWGKIQIGDKVYGDVKIFPDEIVEPWDWTKTNTHHDPGIMIRDIRDLLEAGAKHIVMGLGYEKAMGIYEQTRIYIILQTTITFYAEPTDDAIKIYNEITKSGKKKVGALIHSTC